MSDLKVLQLNKAYYPHTGGIELIVQTLAEGLRKIPGVSSEVLVCGGPRKTVATTVNSVPVRYVAQLGAVASLPISPSYPYWLSRAEADILHVHEPFPLGDLSVLSLAHYRKWLSGKKVLVWWHSDIIRQRWVLPVYGAFLRQFLAMVEKVVVATPNHIHSSSFLPQVGSKCVVIPFGIEPGRFALTGECASQVAELRRSFGGRIVLFVGRLVYYKGLEYLIEAMRWVPDAVLVVVGTGPLRGRLQRLSEQWLGCPGKVVFLGAVAEHDLCAWYHACDVFVLPSVELSEAFGLVQLEAMACAKPVVTTDLPTGVTYVNQHGHTGLVVPRRNSRALAEAINILLDDRQLAAEMGHYAKRRVEQEFTVGRMVESVARLYTELVQ